MKLSKVAQIRGRKKNARVLIPGVLANVLINWLTALVAFVCAH